MKTFALGIDANLEECMDSFFVEILEKGAVDAVFILTRSQNGLYNPMLISKPHDVKKVNPFAAVMPINAATLLSQITRLSPSPKKIAVVLKPCEYRALIELVKLKQVSLENLVLFVTDCLGTFHVHDYLDIVGSKGTLEILKDLEMEDELDKLRTACKTCTHSVPDGDNIDVAFYLIGLKNQLFIDGMSEKGVEILEKIGLKEAALPEERNGKVREFLGKRKKNAQDMDAETRKRVFGLDNISSTLSRCISCHNCMAVCPICYCKECFFESPTFEYDAEKYLRWSERKGSIRMPVGTFLFHMGRMNHMAVSCVNCGMCEQACPSRIPLLSIFKFVGTELQTLFNYEPGRRLDEPIPLIVYREEELEPK